MGLRCEKRRGCCRLGDGLLRERLGGLDETIFMSFRIIYFRAFSSVSKISDLYEHVWNGREEIMCVFKGI